MDINSIFWSIMDNANHRVTNIILSGSKLGDMSVMIVFYIKL